jgi:hypothetical protein
MKMLQKGRALKKHARPFHLDLRALSFQALFDPLIESWQYEQGEQRRGDEASDDDGCKRTLHLGASSTRDCHWNEAQACDLSSHQDRAQPCRCPLFDRIGYR